MPLAQVYKASRRSPRLKGRPQWQDLLPPEKELRDAYAIAARHVDRFARAFVAASRDLLSDEVLKEIRAKLRDGTPREVLDSVPWFNPGTTDTLPLWSRLSRKIGDALSDVVQQSGQAEFQRLQVPLRFEIRKQEVPTVPINPFSLAWIQERAGQLVADVSSSQRDTIRDVIFDGFSQGKRADAILAEIQESVGLLPRERLAVLNRRTLHEQAGLSSPQINRLVAKYRDDLLRKRAQRIARTETIAAQAQGRNDAWRLAEESGQLPTGVVRTWIAAPISPNPNRPCAICLELDGKTAAIGEPYDSALIGTIMRPPSHPQCRCTETLGRLRGRP